MTGAGQVISLEDADAIEATSLYFLWGCLQVGSYSVLTLVVTF